MMKKQKKPVIVQKGNLPRVAREASTILARIFKELFLTQFKNTGVNTYNNSDHKFIYLQLS